MLFVQGLCFLLCLDLRNDCSASLIQKSPHYCQLLAHLTILFEHGEFSYLKVTLQTNHALFKFSSCSLKLLD